MKLGDIYYWHGSSAPNFYIFNHHSSIFPLISISFDEDISYWNIDSNMEDDIKLLL